MSAGIPHDERVLILLPTSQDGKRACVALTGAGFRCTVCADLSHLCREVASGAGVALLTEEALTVDRGGCLAETLRTQPPWSDFPLVILARQGAAGRPVAFRELTNVALVERPVRLRSLLSVIRAALRSRRHQYAVRSLLSEREQQAEVLRQNEEALREADRKKDDFLALLAHELRNPLAPLRNGLQVLRMTRDPQLQESSQQMMERQLGHMVRLIDDLLDISRINRNKLELRLARVTLESVVNSAIESSRPAIEAAGHNLRVELPTEAVFLNADLMRLAQVFANLLINSAKYTEPGGRIVLTGRRDGDQVVVTVEDSGIGIPPDSLSTIFNMFSQVDRSVERSTGGLGIGLALVKRLVELHDGTVTAASDGPGRGSQFTVRLPAALTQQKAKPELAAERSVPAVAARRRILVVDDNRDSAESMVQMLRLLGNEVDVAHDGREAVDRVATFRPQVVLMDIGMPHMNGLEATRRIREQPGGSDVTIIALTGWGQDGDRLRSRAAGCDAHMVKPVSFDELERLLAGPSAMDAAGSDGDPRPDAGGRDRP